MTKLPSKRAAMLAIGCMLALSTPMAAQAEEVDYAPNVKGWRVFSGPAAIAGGDMCYASKDNGQVELRMATDGSGEWLVGVPYYDSEGEVEGGFGFNDPGGYSEIFTFTAYDGWAYTSVPAPEALSGSSVLSITLDRGEQVFDLTGSAAAMTKVEECVQNGGVPPRKPKVAARVDYEEPIEDDAYRFGDGCPKLGAVVSEDSGRPAKAEFRYRIADGRATLIYWLDFDGQPVEMDIFDSDNNLVTYDSYVGHSFIVKDFDGTCYGGFYEVQPGKNVFVVR